MLTSFLRLHCASLVVAISLLGHWVPCRGGPAGIAFGPIPEAARKSEVHTAAVEALRASEFDRTIELAERVLREHPEDPTAHLLVALAELGRNRHAAALRQAERVRTFNPGWSVEILRNLAAAYGRLQRFHLAEDCLREAAAIDATPEVLRETAALYLAQGRAGPARELLEKLPRDPSSQLDASRACLRLGDYRAARAHALQVLEAQPDHEGAHLLAAGAELFLGNIEDATSRLEALPPRAAVHPLIEHYLTLAHLVRGDDSAAIAHATRLLGAMPKLREGNLAAAVAYQKTGDANQTAAHAAVVLEANPADAVAHLAAAAAAITSDNRTEARRSLQKAAPILFDLGEAATVERILDNWSSAEAGAFLLVVLLQAESMHLPALAVLDRASTEEPLFAILRARSEAAVGRPADAVAIYEKLTTTNAHLITPYAELAREAVRAGDASRALDWLERAGPRTHEHVKFALTAGELAFRAGRHAAAETWYRRALQAQPDSALAHNQLAWTLLTQAGPTDEALMHARRAHTLDPDRSSITDTLGWILYQRGDYEAAYLTYAPLFNQPSIEPGILFHAGQVCARRGERALAAELIERALNLSPEFDGASEARERLARLMAGP